MPHRQKRSHLTNIKWNFLPPHQYLSRDKHIGGGLHTFNENVIKSRPSTANPSANPSSNRSSSKIQQKYKHRRPMSALQRKIKRQREVDQEIEADKLEQLTENAAFRKRKAELSFRRPELFTNGYLAKYMNRQQVAIEIGSSIVPELLSDPKQPKMSVKSFQKQRKLSQEVWDKLWNNVTILKSKPARLKLASMTIKNTPFFYKVNSPPQSPQAATVRVAASTVLKRDGFQRFKHNLQWRSLAVERERKANEKIVEQRRRRRERRASLKSFTRKKNDPNEFNPESVRFLQERYGSWVNKRGRRKSATLDRMVVEESRKQMEGEH